MTNNLKKMIKFTLILQYKNFMTAIEVTREITNSFLFVFIEADSLIWV